MPKLPKATVTSLVTDIEGSTRLWEEHPEGMKSALARHDHILRSTIEGYGGYVFTTAGDAFAAAFGRAHDAVSAALDAQLALVAEEWWEGVAVAVHMALNTGEAEEREGDYFGPAVNRAARLLAAGHGGQVLVSRTTQEIVAHQLSGQIGLADLGEYRLRDLDPPEQVFQLTHPEVPAEFLPLTKGPPAPLDQPDQYA